MADKDLVIQLNPDASTENAFAPVQGGKTRIVRAVPTVFGLSPIIWISREVTKDSNGEPAHDCLVLINKNPPQAVPATISLAALEIDNAPRVVVEW